MGLIRTALASPAVAKMTSPHTPDDYLSLLNPMLTVSAVRGKVVSVEADPVSKLVVVRGDVDDAAVRAAIDEAGYEAEM